jgi:hypothetical protein
MPAKRKLTAWTRLVKSEYAAGKKRNAAFTFGDALKSAKSKYKKG